MSTKLVRKIWIEINTANESPLTFGLSYQHIDNYKKGYVKKAQTMQKKYFRYIRADGRFAKRKTSRKMYFYRTYYKIAYTFIDKEYAGIISMVRRFGLIKIDTRNDEIMPSILNKTPKLLSRIMQMGYEHTDIFKTAVSRFTKRDYFLGRLVTIEIYEKLINREKWILNIEGYEYEGNYSQQDFTGEHIDTEYDDEPDT